MFRFNHDGGNPNLSIMALFVRKQRIELFNQEQKQKMTKK